MVIHAHPNCPSHGGNAAETRAAVPPSLDQRLQGFASLIHELLSRDLVQESGTGVFVLREDVQDRLRELSEAPARSTPRVFIGRKCESCGLIRVTRLVSGLRMCSDCRILLGAGSTAPTVDSTG
jgi:hypothetical protein